MEVIETISFEQLFLLIFLLIFLLFANTPRY